MGTGIPSDAARSELQEAAALAQAIWGATSVKRHINRQKHRTRYIVTIRGVRHELKKIGAGWFADNRPIENKAKPLGCADRLFCHCPGKGFLNKKPGQLGFLVGLG